MLLPGSVRLAPMKHEAFRPSLADPELTALFFARKGMNYLQMDTGLCYRGSVPQMAAHEAQGLLTLQGFCFSRFGFEGFSFHLLREHALGQFVQHGAGFAAGPVGQSTVKGIGDGLYALMGQGLKAHGQIPPAQQAARGESDFYGVGEVAGGSLAHEQLAHFIGIVHHGGAQRFGQRRETLEQQLLFHGCIGIVHFADGETVQPCEVLALSALVQARIIASTIGIGRGHETEHGVRLDNFTPIFCNAQGGTVQHTVQASGDFWRSQVDLIQEKNRPVTHGKRKRAVFKGHVAVLDRQMPHQIGELQPPVSCHLKDGVVKSGRQLLDAACFAAARGAEYIKRFLQSLWVEKPDHYVAAGLVKQIVRGKGRGIGRGSGVASYSCAGWFTAEHLTGVEVGGLKRIKARSKIGVHHFSCVFY